MTRQEPRNTRRIPRIRDRSTIRTRQKLKMTRFRIVLLRQRERKKSERGMGGWRVGGEETGRNQSRWRLNTHERTHAYTYIFTHSRTRSTHTLRHTLCLNIYTYTHTHIYIRTHCLYADEEAREGAGGREKRQNARVAPARRYNNQFICSRKR